jgi:hypothetical protein
MRRPRTIARCRLLLLGLFVSLLVPQGLFDRARQRLQA